MNDVFPKRLKQLRLEKGLTQEKIAEVLNIKRSTYGEYERGKISPPIEKIETLAEIFSVAPQYLIGWENQSSSTSNDNLVGTIVRSLRKNRRISSEEFAKELGISTTDLKNYENGTSIIPNEIAKVMAFYFSVSVEELMNVTTLSGAIKIFNDSEQKLRTLRFKRWAEEFGDLTFTNEEVEKFVDYGKFILYQRKERTS